MWFWRLTWFFFRKSEFGGPKFPSRVVCQRIGLAADVERIGVKSTVQRIGLQATVTKQ